MRAALVLLALVAASAGLLAYQALRDPLAALAPVGAIGESIVQDEALVARSDPPLLVHRVALPTSEAGVVRFAVRRPVQAEGHLPVVVLAAGLRKGRDQVADAPAMGQTALVVLEYPLPRRVRVIDLLNPASLVRLYRGAMRAPAQLAAAAAWARAQPWADPDRVVLVGASLGSIVAPAAWRLADGIGARPAAGAFGYGGADIQALAEAGLAKGTNPVLLWGASRLLGTILAPLDPLRHLPAMRGGPFLILSGTADGLIPERSVRLLETLTPQPKTIIAMPGGHVGDEAAATAAAVGALKGWLVERGLAQAW
ncbi:MAG: hypothetical protein JNK11_13075 [Alphaproteobacteria bacterium]|nr:hypothetical protein [Alphaproteobacteria bacterium]